MDLQQARYKLQDAKRAAENGDNVNARRLAEQALIDARIAETKTQLGKATAIASEARARAASQGRSPSVGY